MKFSELVDIEELRQLCESFTAITGTVTAILELDGNILVATGWQDICTCFHRVNPTTAFRCKESDTVLAGKLKVGELANIYKCKNGLVDVAVPIKIRDEHVATFFTGQFFLESPDPDFFIRQAKEFSFDKDSYLDAMQKVPILSTDDVESMVGFFSRLGKLFGEMGLSNKELEDANAELKRGGDRRGESEERFRQVAMTNWVWEVDLEGRYTYCSENVIETLGYSREEIIGKTPFDFMSQKEANRVGEIFTELIASRKRIIDLESWNVTKNGSEICLLTNGVPFYDNSGNLMGYRGGDKDITDRKRAEEELVKHKDQLELLVDERTLKLKEAQAELIQGERLATLGSLTATVSHELRNPLGTIQTALFSIEESLERNDSSQVARTLELADRSISRCVTIIEELNSYARVKDLDISETSVDDWLRAVFKEQSIPEEISCELDLSSGVRASFDHEKLRQVVVNLIANAVHALQDKQSNGKHLRVSTHLLDNKYEIRISDNGIGMTSDIKEKVFEPLFSTKGFGVGLGMVIVKTLVDQHHGEINIESKEGEGTTVTLRLPINFSGERKNQTI